MIGTLDVDGFVDRLALLVSEHKSANAFAKVTGVGQTNLRKYLAGTTPGLDKVIQIAHATGVSITWLATGEGPRDSATALLHLSEGTQPEHGSPGMLQIVDPKALEDGAYVVLPRLDVRASAGEGSFNDGEDVKGFLAFNAAHLRAMGINPSLADVIEIEGRSMMPTFVHGELVVVDRSSIDIISGNIYAVRYRNTLRIKRLQQERTTVVLVSDNKVEGYIDERIEGPDLADFHVVGRVRRHVRSL